MGFAIGFPKLEPSWHHFRYIKIACGPEKQHAVQPEGHKLAAAAETIQNRVA
jgi:hypothetical protein